MYDTRALTDADIAACKAEFDELRKHNNALKWTLICYGLIMLMSVLASQAHCPSAASLLSYWWESCNLYDD